MATRKQRRKEAKAKALLDKCAEVSQEVSHLLLLGNVAADFGTSPQQLVDALQEAASSEGSEDGKDAFTVCEAIALPPARCQSFAWMTSKNVACRVKKGLDDTTPAALAGRRIFVRYAQPDHPSTLRARAVAVSASLLLPARIYGYTAGSSGSSDTLHQHRASVEQQPQPQPRNRAREISHKQQQCPREQSTLPQMLLPSLLPPLPPGLALIPGFVTEQEERDLLMCVRAAQPTRRLKMRGIQHFGHHFDYDTFTVSAEHVPPIPAPCADLIPRLRRAALTVDACSGCVTGGHCEQRQQQHGKRTKQRGERQGGWDEQAAHQGGDEEQQRLRQGSPGQVRQQPQQGQQQQQQKDASTIDQLTVNYYEPGQGIPPHVDVPWVFGDTIFIVSLASGISMVFKPLDRPDLSEQCAAGGDERDGGDARDDDGAHADTTERGPSSRGKSFSRAKLSHCRACPEQPAGVESQVEDEGSELRAQSCADQQQPHTQTGLQEQRPRQQAQRKDQQLGASGLPPLPPLELHLPARSLLVVGDEARYKWTHCIPARRTDIVLGNQVPRQPRISLTFRSVKQHALHAA